MFRADKAGRVDHPSADASREVGMLPRDGDVCSIFLQKAVS